MKITTELLKIYRKSLPPGIDLDDWIISETSRIEAIINKLNSLKNEEKKYLKKLKILTDEKHKIKDQCNHEIEKCYLGIPEYEKTSYECEICGRWR